MTVKRPTAAEIAAAAEAIGLRLGEADIAEFTAMIGDTVEAYYAPFDSLPDYVPQPKYPRTPGYRPDAAEDPLHAWYVKTSVKGARRGKLKGRQVVLKDNIALAGVPMMNGASTLEGYVPDVDATVATRVLDAGGEIVGKANCEYFCYSGGSHTNATGPTHNPRKRGYSAGGSSSGCAALVGSGAVGMAIGGDQGGSIREPAAFCGIYGMKPTYGLVPYTGAFPIELTLDHLGPMTATVADNALLLEVIAGPDGLDPRQTGARAARYTGALGKGVDELCIGVVTEGFGHPHSQADVDQAVRAAAARFKQLGAIVEEVSIPMHRLGMAIWAVIAIEGTFEQMMRGNALGSNWRGLYVTSMLDAHRRWREQADKLSEILKLGTLAGQHLRAAYGGHYYAKAQNLSRKLRAAYDEAFVGCDLLLMPTAPIKAPPLPPADASRAQQMAPGFDPITNTAPFDCTGHPAMNVPCALRDGLPVGMMLIGRYHEETTIYRAADAFERATDWTQL
jgi:amidase